MIVDAFLILVSAIIYLISGIFQLINFIIPAKFFDAIGYFFTKISALDIFLPVTELMQALTLFLSFLAFWYTIKIVMWTYHIIRHGGDADVPGLGQYSRSHLETELDRVELKSKAAQGKRKK